MSQPIQVTRREAIAASLVTAASLATVPAKAADSEASWIDAHSHIWPAETDRYPLVEGLSKKDLSPPSFTDEELLAIARPAGVARVVLIQHSVYHLFDNSYLTDMAARHPQRFRVVGMVDDSKPAPGEAMKELLKQRVTGFRITPFIRKEKPQAWLDTPGMQEMWETGAKTGQAMCCLIDPADLPRVDAMCRRYPDTPVVIDHFARIGADGEIRPRDLKALCDLAQHSNVNVKISAFYALGKKQPPYLDLVPMIEQLWQTYGARRLMWASDAPYQLEHGNSYAASLALVRDRLDFLSDDDRQWLLRGTAERVYFFV
jgi:predicted TIM-barrel fold metal-dependent hydrolase